MANQRHCQRCGDEIIGGGNKRLYCLAEKSRICPICGDSYTVICQSKDRAMAKTCGAKCQHLLAEQTRQELRNRGEYAPMTSGYKIPDRVFAERHCSGCGDAFTPRSATQKYCTDKPNPTGCPFCGDIFQPRRPCDIIEQVYCSTLCGVLGSSNSQIFKHRLSEYREINRWAVNFAEREGRKPNRVDIVSYFNIRPPATLNEELWDRPSRSTFEDVVVAELRRLLDVDAVIERERQPLRDGKRRFELDVWVPSLNLAFEVQDFATHSRDSDSEMCIGRVYVGAKKGPAYHELKRRLAADQLGVKLYDIWEDAIMDGSYKLQLSEAVEVARAKLAPPHDSVP